MDFAPWGGRTGPAVFHRCQGFRDLYGVGRRVASGLYDVALGPSGLYASPEMEDGCSGALSAGSSRSFAASESRASHGMSGLIMSAWQRCWRHSNCPYSEPAPTCCALPKVMKRYSRYNATIRNQVRRTQHNGVSVRAVSSADDIHAYHAIHTHLAALKGNYSILYPVSLLTEMVLLRNHARLLVAEHEGRMIAGGGCFSGTAVAVMYWHGASDRDYSPVSVSHVCRSRCGNPLGTGIGRRIISDFGGSGGLKSLEQFKALWNARPELNWAFQYSHPFWSRVARLKHKIGRAHA